MTSSGTNPSGKKRRPWCCPFWRCWSSYRRDTVQDIHPEQETWIDLERWIKFSGCRLLPICQCRNARFLFCKSCTLGGIRWDLQLEQFLDTVLRILSLHTWDDCLCRWFPFQTWSLRNKWCKSQYLFIWKLCLKFNSAFFIGVKCLETKIKLAEQYSQA